MTEQLIRAVDDWRAVWRARIIELELTHLEVDGLAGLSEGHTAKILCGMRKPTGRTIARLCDALALSQAVVIDIEREAVLRAGATKRKRDYGQASVADFREHDESAVNAGDN